jgi:metal-responsive CopG/Arc/MetJ family transcriptional regulator
MKIPITITIEEDLLKKINKARGLVPRSLYISKILEEKIKGGEHK